MAAKQNQAAELQSYDSEGYPYLPLLSSYSSLFQRRGSKNLDRADVGFLPLFNTSKLISREIKQTNEYKGSDKLLCVSGIFKNNLPDTDPRFRPSKKHMENA
jgi:hypothetical protein